MKQKFNKEIKKVRRVMEERPFTAGVVGVSATILLFIVIRSFISLLPVIGVAIIGVIAYKLYRRGFFG